MKAQSDPVENGIEGKAGEQQDGGQDEEKTRRVTGQSHVDRLLTLMLVTLSRAPVLRQLTAGPRP